MRIPEILRRFEARAAGWRLPGMWGVWAAFAVGLAAIPAIAWRHFWIALVLIAIARMLAVLAGRSDPSEALDAVAFAGLAFGFALADPAHAVAACFFVFGYVAAIAVPKRLALRETLVLALAFALACLLPERFSLIAYLLGIAGFVLAGLRFAGVT
jgi:hypothetical protein